MLYKIFNKIENVRSFAINEGQIYLSSQSGLSDISGKVYIESTKSLQEIKFENPYFYISDIDGNSYLIFNEVLFFGNIFIKKVIDKNLLLVSRNGCTELFNIEEKKFNFFLDYKLFKFLVEGDVIVFYKDKIINCYSLPTTVQLWQYDLKSLGMWKDNTDTDQRYELKDFIGVIDTSLFIKLNANEILVLDMQTGNVNERLTFIDHLTGETTIERPAIEMPFFQTHYIINYEKSMLQGLFVDLYYEISHNNGNTDTTVYGLKNEYEKYGINPQDISKNNVIQGDKLYFLVQEQGRFAILNTILKKIEYVSDPIPMAHRPEVFTKLKEIQVSGDKVYVLANDKVLHIFEKDGS
ncbi:MAG: hypothetical protein IPM42_04620 [Saprospiraceae bacterium]|nr:hypothetical protein [Saprospiraceae bacterium]